MKLDLRGVELQLARSVAVVKRQLQSHTVPAVLASPSGATTADAVSLATLGELATRIERLQDELQAATTELLAQTKLALEVAAAPAATQRLKIAKAPDDQELLPCNPAKEDGAGSGRSLQCVKLPLPVATIRPIDVTDTGDSRTRARSCVFSDHIEPLTTKPSTRSRTRSCVDNQELTAVSKASSIRSSLLRGEMEAYLSAVLETKLALDTRGDLTIDAVGSLAGSIMSMAVGASTRFLPCVRSGVADVFAAEMFSEATMLLTSFVNRLGTRCGMRRWVKLVIEGLDAILDSVATAGVAEALSPIRSSRMELEAYWNSQFRAT